MKLKCKKIIEEIKREEIKPENHGPIEKCICGGDGVVWMPDVPTGVAIKCKKCGAQTPPCPNLDVAISKFNILQSSAREHHLKTRPGYFKAVCDGIKTFEVRKNDRNFRVGDALYLREWDGKAYTGRSVGARIIYILDDPDYCKDGYVILGIKLI